MIAAVTSVRNSSWKYKDISHESNQRLFSNNKKRCSRRTKKRCSSALFILYAEPHFNEWLQTFLIMIHWYLLQLSALIASLKHRYWKKKNHHTLMLHMEIKKERNMQLFPMKWKLCRSFRWKFNHIRSWLTHIFHR